MHKINHRLNFLVHTCWIIFSWLYELRIQIQIYLDLVELSFSKFKRIQNGKKVWKKRKQFSGRSPRPAHLSFSSLRSPARHASGPASGLLPPASSLSLSLTGGPRRPLSLPPRPRKSGPSSSSFRRALLCFPSARPFLPFARRRLLVPRSAEGGTESEQCPASLPCRPPSIP